MRSRKEILDELKKADKVLSKGQTLGYFNVLRGVYVTLLWALELNGNMEKSRKLPSPTNALRRMGFYE